MTGYDVTVSHVTSLEGRSPFFSAPFGFSVIVGFDSWIFEIARVLDVGKKTLY